MEKSCDVNTIFPDADAIIKGEKYGCRGYAINRGNSVALDSKTFYYDFANDPLWNGKGEETFLVLVVRFNSPCVIRYRKSDISFFD